MDQIIDSRFERLEKALATLIDSVTKYHPSTTQAEELKAADQDLSKGLLEVQIHQNNYLRIQQLRQLSASLDAQIRETLISLATTRKDIVSTHTTTYPSGESFPVTYTDLLQYARRISKTTLPPASALAQAQAQAPATSTAAVDAAPTTSSDAAQAAGSVVTPAATLSPGGGQQQQQQQPASSAHTSLPDGMSQYLNPLSGQAFFPWPQEDKIRGGALASNQILAEQGIEVRGFDPAMEEDKRRREEEQRREREEAEKREREEQERRMREEMERGRRERERQREREQAEWRRASVGTAEAGEKKKQFQFTNLEDLDDDED